MPRNTTVRDRHRRQIARTKPDCALCGNPIDYDLPWLDPMSFTVDHVIPINKGGADILENCQPAHRSCNRTKSDRVEGEDPRRRYITTLTW